MMRRCVRSGDHRRFYDAKESCEPALYPAGIVNVQGALTP